jgi:hypothetical protein
MIFLRLGFPYARQQRVLDEKSEITVRARQLVPVSPPGAVRLITSALGTLPIVRSGRTFTDERDSQIAPITQIQITASFSAV